MTAISIKTANKVIPMIYAYSTPEIKRHNGWIKIGYTEKQATDKRQKQQSHTIDVIIKEEWKGNAIFEDGSGEIFHDTDFHKYLQKLGIERKKGTEWFFINGEKSYKNFIEFRTDKGILKAIDTVVPYNLRNEQNNAVEKTVDYFSNHKSGEFLWNAKPRFGKTLSVYDFCKRINAVNVLIITNRPAIANSWYSDYVSFLGEESGYKFVSETESLKGKSYVLSREEYLDTLTEDSKNITFLSLQDLKGSIHFGGNYNKLKYIKDMNWDILVIDEAHEGVDTYKTDVAFDNIKRKFTLHLSGTPFKALANDKFPENAIYNWTYADEQNAKENWDYNNGNNPYENLPKLNLFIYQMSEIIKDELSQGIEIQGETEEYSFDLNVFFETKNGKFIHESSVDKFLNALTVQEKFPFSTQELRNELKHTFWLLNRVESAKALAKKLTEHPVFSEYKIILAAGDGKLEENEETQKSFDKVKKAISENDKTITLSVGQLTTGVTIPEWTAVLMLSNMKSPSLYMQAAFRSQNPCLFSENGQYYRKENAYVFDFDPARTLTIYEQFANDLSKNTADGRGDKNAREENIRTLLNFFPVIGEDENGEMTELDAQKVLSIPRKIRSQEVVRRGFMSDFLFQNISNVFHAPMEIIEIINNFTAVKESKPVNINRDTADELSLDDNGEVDIPDDYVVGKSKDIFGDKIYGEPSETDEIKKTVTDKNKNPDKHLDEIKKIITDPLLDIAQKEYKSDLSSSKKKKLEKELKKETEKIIDKVYADYSIKQKELEAEHEKELSECKTEEEKNKAKEIYENKQKEINKDYEQKFEQSVQELKKTIGEEIVRTVETDKREREKKNIEIGVREHLRGFSRTIPSFLMAYGDNTVTLDNFDKIIPDEVFKEVTSISLDDFCFLRDGGNYKDEETGETKYFEGKLFDDVVFNDSVKEFLSLKEKLSDYFEETNTEDIFDYIPPQKTNQIFTPKWVVKKMVDMLEEENPGCFDMSDKTFIDLYMKSGLYIAEIVKRLYQSSKLKEEFPDRTERLNHIFENQVYGLAPSEIIYKISTNFILGFADDLCNFKHNFVKADALEYAKNGTLEQFLDTIYKNK